VSGSREDLAQRRTLLLARSQMLRDDWAHQVQALRAPLGVADRARDGVQWLARNPQWPLAAVALLVVLRPRRALRLASFAWWGWGVLKRVRAHAAPG
jgi:hypothetical protein